MGVIMPKYTSAMKNAPKTTSIRCHSAAMQLDCKTTRESSTYAHNIKVHAIPARRHRNVWRQFTKSAWINRRTHGELSELAINPPCPPIRRFYPRTVRNRGPRLSHADLSPRRGAVLILIPIISGPLRRRVDEITTRRTNITDGAGRAAGGATSGRGLAGWLALRSTLIEPLGGVLSQ
ncbi:unnamed protein product, partial [Iphiclides podalirius]